MEMQINGNQGTSVDGRQGRKYGKVNTMNSKAGSEQDQKRFEDSRGGGWEMVPDPGLIGKGRTGEAEESVSLKSGMLTYCLRCKKKVPIEKATMITLANGRFSIRSICPDCGGKVSRIVGKNSLGNVLVDEKTGIHAFCLHCREKITVFDPALLKLKNGRRSIRGSCPICKGKVSRIIGQNAFKQMLGEMKSGIGAYCLHCREKITVDNPSLSKLKNGRRSIRGFCPLCKGKVSRIVGKKVFEEMLASEKSEYLAYCLRCKEKIPVKRATFPTLKNGRYSVRGYCPLCDGKVSRILKKVEEAVLIKRMDEELPVEQKVDEPQIEPEVVEKKVPEMVEKTVPEVEHIDVKIGVPEWVGIKRSISPGYCYRCGKEIPTLEPMEEQFGMEYETVRAFCFDCLDYVYQYLDPSVGLNKTIQAYVKEKRRNHIKPELTRAEDTPFSMEMDHVPSISKYEWILTTVEPPASTPDPESITVMDVEEEPVSAEPDESEVSDQEVRETIDALLKDLKDKKRQDSKSDEDMIKEKMLGEILPFFEKQRISSDLEKYGKFSLIPPFRGFCEHETEAEVAPEVEPVVEEVPVLEIIPEEVEDAAEIDEAESIPGTFIGHDEINIQQCRSCERHFCMECANLAKLKKGYHNIPEEMFSDYFEPLCIDCWGKFQTRFEEAQELKEVVIPPPEEEPEETYELDETPVVDWVRNEAQVEMERLQADADKEERRRKMRERIELLRRIRDIRWKVPQEEPEEPEVEELAEEETVEETVEIVEEDEDEYIEANDGRPSKLLNSIGMRLNLITPGSFVMGSKRWKESLPRRRVHIRRPFYISIFPVTQREWKRVLGKNPSFPKGDYLPAVNISWNDCHKFIMKLNALEGSLKYRLPSEAEWEYAARAGSTTRYSFGDDVKELPLYAWMGEDWDVGELHPVGLKRPNEWGLYDVHGNIWEWCQDNWHPNFEGAPTDGWPWEEGGDENRVRRGGTWTNNPKHSETAYRNRNAPGYRYKYLGFRIVKSV